MDHLKTGKDVLRKEAEALMKVMESLDETFNRAAEIIFGCTGRVVLTGMGKSGLVCKKIASTLSSTGTPALFVHPADSLHGDLGMLQRGDVLVVVSNSGETEEVLKIIPWVKRLDIPLVVITGDAASTIARLGDVALAVNVEEACPYNVVPTSSTTATLALGDALAIAVMERRSFKVEDFALLHPGGSLGRKLFLRVEDLMHTGDAVPGVSEETSMKDVILEITSKRFGVTGVYDGEGCLAGIITDGDLRRAIERYDDSLLAKKAGDVMTPRPKVVSRDALAAHALKKMEDFSITSLFVVGDEEARPVGIIHIHDLLRAKVV
ncbi:MAG: KpsF/GutQ family sugar-phosphate isomerase [Syntrophorhabdaceae bacterium]|nr:KpsF/GutQ family sugar-phosphate isomerase [Syntrophorhabdaceae bacterium]